MAILPFIFNQLFILLVPELVVDVAWTLNFPEEVEFVQKFLSIKSNFVILIKFRCAFELLTHCARHITSSPAQFYTCPTGRHFIRGVDTS